VIFLEPFSRKKAAEKKRTVLFAAKGEERPRRLTLAQFERATGLRYLEHLAFTSKTLYEKVRQLSIRALEREKISKRAEWLGICYRNQIFHGAVNTISVRWSGKRLGYAVYAEQTFEEGEFIGEYTGLVRRAPILFSGVNEYCFRYPLYRTGFFFYTIDAKEQGNEISFINHSSLPNCESVVTFNNDLLHLCIRTVKTVPSGEQLTFDYGNGFR